MMRQGIISGRWQPKRTKRRCGCTIGNFGWTVKFCEQHRRRILEP